jgi:hypothetical protein
MTTTGLRFADLASGQAHALTLDVLSLVAVAGTSL